MDGYKTCCFTRREFMVGACCTLSKTAGAVAVTASRPIGMLAPGTVADLAVANIDAFEFDLDPPTNLLPAGLWHAIAQKMERTIQAVYGLNRPNVYKWLVDDSHYGNGIFCASKGSITARDGSISIPEHSGVIVVGVNVTKQLFNGLDSAGTQRIGPGLIAALAHEAAHIYQFRRPTQIGDFWGKLMEGDQNLTRRRPELHADFMSGWCLGRLDPLVLDTAKIDAAARDLFVLGKFTPGDPNDHGTSEQRYACFLRGFFTGRDLRLGVNDAADEGELFLNGILPSLGEP